MKYIVEINVPKYIDFNCIDLKKILEEFYKKQAEITKRLEEREKK